MLVSSIKPIEFFAMAYVAISTYSGVTFRTVPAMLACTCAPSLESSTRPTRCPFFSFWPSLTVGAAASPAATLLNGWIRMAPDGAVTVYSRTTELGQGALTSLAMVVAEELALDPAAVAVEMAPVTEAFMDHGNTLGYGVGAAYYATWGSLSSRDMDRTLRKIAATVRVLLLRAAAQTWTVAETECSAENGLVRHNGGRSLSYAALAPTAASLPVPQDIEPTARAKWRRLGRSTVRFDIPEKTDGSAIYGVDVKRPAMLVATIAQCPMFGGKLVSVDAGTAEKMPGVRKVLKLEDAVAVIATGYSGNLQFMDRDSSFLVDYREATVAVPDGPYQRGSIWAEPDVEHAAALMRMIYDRPDLARETGARARDRVGRALSPAVIGKVARPLSGASMAPTLPWSANAKSVFSGIVSTVSGAASVSTYRVSDAAGSLVPVLAQSSRCGCAPASAAFFQRGEASRSR